MTDNLVCVVCGLCCQSEYAGRFFRIHCVVRGRGTMPVFLAVTCFEYLNKDGYGSTNVIPSGGDTSTYPCVTDIWDSIDNNCNNKIDENGICEAGKGFWNLVFCDTLRKK